MFRLVLARLGGQTGEQGAAMGRIEGHGLWPESNAKERSILIEKHITGAVLADRQEEDDSGGDL